MKAGSKRAFISFVFFVLLLCNIKAYSQTLEGVVFDPHNRIPVSNANVYLEGTTIYMVTDSVGKFKLRVKGAINAPLVISHVSYEPTIVSNPFTALPDTVFLDEKVISIGEIVIEEGKYSRAQKMRAFRRQFLGTSQSAASCVITNEDDIILTYDRKERLLSASAYRPIIIENKYLGYSLHIELKRFEVLYRRVTLSPASVEVVNYEGTSFFKDITPDDNEILQRREAVFRGSSVHFLRALINKSLDDSGYRLYKNGELYKSLPKWFLITDTLNAKKVHLDDKMGNPTNRYGDRAFFTKVQIKYEGKESEAIFFTNELLVDYYGNLFQPENVLFRNYMGQQRIGDMLPADYGILFTQNALVTEVEEEEKQIIGIAPSSEADTLFRLVAKRIYDFQYTVPREKVYLHQDRTQYMAGETIWFKAYQSSSKSYPVRSGVVYVELTDGMNRPVAETKWKLVNGSAAGHIALPDTLASGLYQLRAYTQWMQNFGTEGYFTREIKIASRYAELWGIETDFAVSGNTLSAALRFTDKSKGALRYKLRLNGEVSRAYPLKPDGDGEVHLELELPEKTEYEGTQYFIVETPEGDREFPISLAPPVEFILFPEGGNLVAGLPSKIAFKVTDRLGKGLDAGGVIVDNEGKEVRRFHTQHLGHGYFYFEPEEGKQYTARLDDPVVRAVLPHVYPKGMVMDVRRSGERMRIALKHNLDTSHLLFPFYLTIHQEGVTWFNTYVDMDKNIMVLDIPKEKLPEGIFTITIYDEKLQAYCERLAFINYPEQLNLGLEMNGREYKKRREVVVHMDVKDKKGVIENGDFSVAVVKSGLDEVGARNNFYSDYFLRSELKGRVEAPASYFEKRDTVGLNNLDLLLLTQGWRRYDWDYVVSGKMPDLYYPVERNLAFSGQVELRNRDKNMEDISINALFRRDSTEEMYTTHPGYRGAFRFSGYDFCDTTKVTLSVVDKKNRTLYLSVIRPEGLPTQYYTYGSGISRNDNDSLMVEMSGTIPRSPGESMELMIHELPEVSVTAKTKPRDHRRLHNEAFNLGSYEVVKHRSYGGKWGALGILFYVPGVSVVDKGTYLDIQLPETKFLAKDPPLFILDGFRVDKDVLMSIQPTLIERVEILSVATAMIYGRTSAGAIHFFTRSWDDIADMTPSKTVVHNFVGYNRPKEFYSPNYLESLPDHWIPDHRNTLYWQPNVRINEEGKAEFRFFTSDDKGEYVIHCEGRSADGVIGTEHYRIKVE